MIKRIINRGDTIVEVLIAIVVVSTILTGAYVLSNKSIKGTRSAKEHTVALKYAENQIERLRGAFNTTPPTTIPTAGFCMDETTNNPVLGSCVINNGIDYTVIDSCPAANPRLCTITVTWVSNRGIGNDQVSLAYRLD